VFGPVDLDPVSSVPKLTRAEKIQYWGKRRVLCGGKVDSDSSDAGDDADADSDHEEGEDAKLPIAYHALPVKAITNLIEGFGCRHVIDMSPTPLPLAQKLVEMGCSYFALCGTEMARELLQDQLHSGLVKALKNSTNPLYDKRYVKSNAPGNATGSAAKTGDAPETEVEKPDGDAPDPDAAAAKKKARKNKKSTGDTPAAETPAAAAVAAAAPKVDLKGLLAAARDSLGKVGTEGEADADADAEADGA
jgi:hypothetical protein